MSFIIFIVYSVIATILVNKRKITLSQAFIPIIFFTIICTIALGQNYTMSYMQPPINDGIGISNFLAAFILPEDGWSYEMFKLYFTSYLWLSIILVICYVVSIFIEKSFVGLKVFLQKS